MAYPYLIQGKNIVIIIDNEPHTITSTHLNYEKIKEAIKTNDWETVEKIINPAKEIRASG